MTAPLITIGIPTYNRVGYLAECLESCLGQVGVAPGSYEVIVSNNCSTDETEAYLNQRSAARKPNDPDFRVLHQSTGIRPTSNWLACLNEARGEYFLLMSDDDAVEPGLVAAVIRALSVTRSANPSGVMVGFTDIDSRGNLGRRLENRPGLVSGRDFFSQLVLREQRYRWCAVLARVEILKKSRVFERPFPGSGMFADGAAMLACCASGPILRIREPLVRYRIHAGNDSRRPDLAANREGHSAFIHFAETLEGKSIDWVGFVRFWCADGYLYQLARWLLKRQLRPAEVIAEMDYSAGLARNLAWAHLPAKARRLFVTKQMALKASVGFAKLFGGKV